MAVTIGKSSLFSANATNPLRDNPAAEAAAARRDSIGGAEEPGEAVAAGGGETGTAAAAKQGDTSVTRSEIAELTAVEVQESFVEKYAPQVKKLGLTGGTQGDKGQSI